MSQSGFPAALVARHQIQFSGADITVDSFNSSDPAKSTNGQYDPAKAGDYGNMISTSSLINLISVGNARIFGRAYTGYGGSVTVGTNGSIGTHAWQLENQGIQPGYVMSNANYNFPDTSLPYTSGLVPAAGDIVFVDYITNGTFVSGMPTLPQLNTNESLGLVTTNTMMMTTSVYPGSQSGLITNAVTWITTNSYPSNVSELITNCMGFITVSAYPGQQQCLVTNFSGTITSSTYPGPVTGLTTNVWATAHTNTTVYIASSNAVCGITTYISPTLPTNVCSYIVVRPPQTYKYTVIDHYTYTYGTNYTYTYTTNYSYTYPNSSWTYAYQFTYTYPVYTYTYQLITFSYTVYSPSPSYYTNHYDHMLVTGDYYTTQPLAGMTYVSGAARLVMPNGLAMSGTDQITVSSNASLNLYVGNSSCNVNPGNVFNLAGLATAFAVYCTPQVTTLTLNGDGNFSGLLIAPRAHVLLTGSGFSSLEFSGSVFAESITVSGYTHIHFDEALNFYAPLFPPAVANMGRANLNTDNQFQFDISGATGFPYIIEATTDLVNWNPVCTNIAPFTFIDADPSGTDHRYYRAKYSP